MKKFILPLIMLITGILIGLFYNSITNKESSKIAPSTISPFIFSHGSYEHGLISQIVPRPTAVQNITDFQTMNRAAGTGAIQGTTGIFNGFFIDAQSLKTILSDQTLAGISFYLGKHPDHPGTTDKIISIYFTGAKPNPTAPPQYKNSQDVYEYVDPCPTACGDLVKYP